MKLLLLCKLQLFNDEYTASTLDINYVEPRISCSGYVISETERMGVFDVNIGHQYPLSGGGGVFCKFGQICIQDTANQPQHGYMTFKNIFYTMLNMLTVISTEDWTDLLYISQDSISDYGAAFFYSFCIYLMTFIMVPMFIAVITTSFSHVHGDMRASAFSSTRKTKFPFSASIFDKKPLSSQKQSSTSHRHDDSSVHEEWIYEDVGLGAANMFRANSILHDFAYRLTRAKWFPYAGSILVVLDTMIMGFYNSKISDHDKGFLGKFNRYQ